MVSEPVLMHASGASVAPRAFALSRILERFLAVNVGKKHRPVRTPVNGSIVLTAGSKVRVNPTRRGGFRVGYVDLSFNCVQRLVSGKTRLIANCKGTVHQVQPKNVVNAACKPAQRVAGGKAVKVMVAVGVHVTIAVGSSVFPMGIIPPIVRPKAIRSVRHPRPAIR